MVGCIHKWPWSWLVPLQIYFWLSLKGCDKWRRFLKTGRKQIPPSLTSETLHGSGCMEVNHSFLSDLCRKQSPVWKGRVQKKVALVILSTFQFETDFDAHGCNTNIISFTHFPHCSYSVCRETCQRLRRMIFKVFIFITKNSPVLTLTLKHTLLFNRGIFSKINPLQQRGVGAVVFSFCFLIGSLLSHFTLQRNSSVTKCTLLNVVWLKCEASRWCNATYTQKHFVRKSKFVPQLLKGAEWWSLYGWTILHCSHQSYLALSRGCTSQKFIENMSIESA